MICHLPRMLIQHLVLVLLKFHQMVVKEREYRLYGIIVRNEKLKRTWLVSLNNKRAWTVIILIQT